MSIREIDHHLKVIDMLLTAHSYLRDRNRLWAAVVDTLLLIASVLLCAMVFFDTRIFDAFDVDVGTAKVVIGASSVVVFTISLLSLRFDWKGTAQSHQDAVKLLGRCKAHCQQLRKCDSEPSRDAIKEVCSECAWAFEVIPPIKESKFLKLKGLHKRKRLISQMIDDHPGCPVFIMRCKLLRVAVRTFFQETPKRELGGKSNESSATGSGDESCS